MAQLGNALRITFESARMERGGGSLPWQRRSRDQSIYLDWRAAQPAGPIGGGSITLAELRRWKSWFADAGAVAQSGSRSAKLSADPVTRLWTPLAGQTVEFFLWPEAVGTLALLALFIPDPATPDKRIAVETSVSAGELRAFGEVLESEAEAISDRA
jgi:hypothetical protein